MSTSIGRQAEKAVAQYLKKRGHKILEQNWRTRWCEIDLITQAGNTVYFVEVKYRGNNLNGSGLDYITNRKLGQMHYAAEFWLSSNAKPNLDYRLAAAEVGGVDFKVSAWLDQL